MAHALTEYPSSHSFVFWPESLSLFWVNYCNPFLLFWDPCTREELDKSPAKASTNTLYLKRNFNGNPQPQSVVSSLWCASPQALGDATLCCCSGPLGRTCTTSSTRVVKQAEVAEMMLPVMKMKMKPSVTQYYNLGDFKSLNGSLIHNFILEMV